MRLSGGQVQALQSSAYHVSYTLPHLNVCASAVSSCSCPPVRKKFRLFMLHLRSALADRP